MLLGYLWIVLTLGTLLGVRQGTYLLLLLHVLYTVIYDNPALTHTTGTYENKIRACLFDSIIACTLLMIASWDDSVKVEEEKEPVVEKKPENKKEVEDAKNNGKKSKKKSQ